jgi:hypothetical protein
MKLAMGLKIAAEIPFGLLAAVSLFMGNIEILRGNFHDGIWTLLGAVFFGALIWFAWKSPLATGVKLVFGGILFLAFSIMGRNPDEGLDEFIMGGTALMTGLLLLLSAWVTPKAPE